MIRELIGYIGAKHPMQEKYLDKILSELSSDDAKELEEVIEFFSEQHSIEEMGEAYLVFIKDTINETKYFVENDYSRYRYNTLSEVNGNVYQNEDYMSKYMLGLQLSGYLWDNHRQILHWFRDKFLSFGGNNYLEIGPGHGQYYAEAIKRSGYKHYYAIDLSQTSLNMTRNYINRFAKEENYSLIHESFYDYQPSCLFDGVCISEVLEHVEEPLTMLERIAGITTKSANIYINVPINAPAIDHIYLFKSTGEVKGLVEQAGLKIKTDLAVTGNGWPLEKAIKRKTPINYAMVVGKTEITEEEIKNDKRRSL